MKSKAVSACMLAVTLALVGCSQVPVTQSELEADQGTEIATTSEEKAQPAKGLMGIRLEVGKTRIQPFLELLGEPLKVARVDERTVVLLYQSNRLLSGKQNDTPLLIVLPENDSRADSLPSQTLLLEFHQKEQAWVLEGLRMQPSSAEPTKSAQPEKKQSDK